MSESEVPSVPPTEAGAGDGAPVKAENRAASEGEDSKEQLTIKVTDNSTEVFFRVRPHTPLKRLIDGFCKRTGKDRNSLRFLYDGERIQDDDTPESLGMEDNDVVEVLNQQIGGSF